MSATIITKQRGTFWRRFVPLFGAGLVGVAAGMTVILPVLQQLVASAPPGVVLPPLPVLQPDWQLLCLIDSLSRGCLLRCKQYKHSHAA